MAANQKMRGLSRQNEVSQDKLYRDIRTPMEKVSDFFGDTPSAGIAFSLFLLLPAPFFPTFFMLVCVPLIYWMTGKALNKEQTLPMLLPREAGIKDPKDPKPGRFSNHTSRGEYLVGNLRFSDKPYELWLSFSHLLTHCLLLGSTGSGKTETLVSMTANYLSVGSGVMYADAKAAPKLGWQIFSLARYFGREEDFRALNYIKGNTSLKPDPAVRRGNNVNLFAYGSAESITQIIVSLMPPGGGENKLFSERAVGLISAVMPALVDLRDKAGLKITPGVVRKALEFEEVQKLNRAKPVTPESREALRAYLTSLPGYSENPVDRNGRPTDKQAEEVTRQFGFAQAYFTRALASLSDTYGDIYMVGRGEINFLDQVLRRRICIVMIPALEKAPDEMKNLAKIVLAAQKNAISTGLPPDIEGRKEDVLDNLPTTAPTPYGIINDEFAFMMTPGYGAVLAQARGLFCAVTIAGQDYAGMKREDADEAEQIAENTRLKIIMASEGIGATKELIQEIAGEGVASVAQSYAMDDESMSGMYRDSKSANFERRSRVDTQDTRNSVEGEGIIFWRDNVVPVSMFYHGLDEDTMVSDFIIHRLIDVSLPTRGYGATLLEQESPMIQALCKAVREGQSLDIERSEIPETLSTPLKPALIQHGQYRNSLPIRRFKNELEKEGTLFASLMSQYDQLLMSATDEDDFAEEGSLNNRPAINIETSLPDTVATMAPPESSLEFERAGDNKIYQIDDESLKDTLAKLHEEAEADPTLQAPRPPEVPKSPEPSDAPEAASLSTKKQEDRKGNPAKNTWFEDYTFLINPQDVASYTQTEVTVNESIAANQIGISAAKLEEALGTSHEEARAVGRQTAIATAKAINYPGSASRPTPPKTEAEEQLVIDQSTGVINDWLNKARSK